MMSHLAKKISNERGFASAVLPNKHHQRLRPKISVVEGGGVEGVVAVLLLEGEEHLLVEDLHLVDHPLVVPLPPAPVLAPLPHPLWDPAREGGGRNGKEKAACQKDPSLAHHLKKKLILVLKKQPFHFSEPYIP